MSIVIWYISTLILGFIGFTFTRKITTFPDKGYAFARIFGLIVLAYSSWLFTYVFKHSPNLPLVWSVFCVVFVLCFVLNLKVIKAFDKSIIKLIMFEELLFIALFGLMLMFRAANPMIIDIEKFMDYGIINGLLRSSTIPPVDIWFSGQSINYYYFGHFSFAQLFKLTQIPSGIAYNIAVAYLMALSAVAGFSIIFAFTRKYFYSFIGALALIAGGNLDLMYNQLLVHKASYFYAEARSLIPYTINEFPSYSFLIGDLHAHILDIPNVLLFLALLISVFHTRALLKRKVFVASLILVLGVLGVTHSWDFFIYTPLLMLVILFASLHKKRNYLIAVRNAIGKTLIIVVTSLVIFLPFYLNFKEPIDGITFIKPEINFLALFRMFGFFIILITPAYYVFKFKKQLSDDDKLNVLLSLFGFILVLIPSFFVVKDIYFKLNPPYLRANTVFKLWYQAWIVLSLCVPYSLKVTFEHLKTNRLLFSLYSVIVLALVFFVFEYTFISVKYIVGPSYISKGLDGTAYLNERDAGAKKMIDWINTNVTGQPVLLEADGKSYSSDSVVSSYTGLPTPVGWSEHELGWRNNWGIIANRMGDIQKMYTSTSVDDVKNLVQKYNIAYVVLGEKEKSRYGQDAGAVLKYLSTISVSHGDSLLLAIH